MLWLGRQPPESTRIAYRNRDLDLIENPAGPLDALLPQACGLVLAYDPSKPSRFRSDLAAMLDPAMNHGLYIGVQIPGDADLARCHLMAGEVAHARGLYCDLQQQRAGVKLMSGYKHVVEKVGFSLAEFIARHDPGPPFNPALKVEIEDEEAKILLARAFDDCRELFVRRLGGGRSGADAYSVHAVFDDAQSSRPLPFFVKIGPRPKIEVEKQKYGDYAHHHVPFQFRPNLEYRRCVPGSSKSILVGNFVEEAEPLWARIQRGASRGAIHSLFDDAMRGWWQPAQLVPAAHGSLQKELRGLVAKIDRIPDAIVARAIADGARARDDIKKAVAALPDVAYRHGQTHGDMHGLNVMVYRDQAFLIDFASAKYGPIVADPASLEVFVAFEVPDAEREKQRDLQIVLGDTDEENEAPAVVSPEEDRRRHDVMACLATYAPDDQDRAWMQVIDELYTVPCLTEAPVPKMQPFRHDWLWGAVRAIRTEARAVRASPHDYCITVALFLLRGASFAPDTQRQGFRRAYSYVVADRLLTAVLGELGGKA